MIHAPTNERVDVRATLEQFGDQAPRCVSARNTVSVLIVVANTRSSSPEILEPWDLGRKAAVSLTKWGNGDQQTPLRGTVAA